MWLDYSRMHDDSSFSVTSQGSLPWLQSRTTTTIYTKRDTQILTLYSKQICKVWFYFNTPLHTKLWWLQFCWYYSTTIYTKRDTPILTLYSKQICKVWFYFNTPLHTKLWWLQFCWYYSTELWAQNWYHNTISCKTYLKTQYNTLVHRALYSSTMH